MKPINIRDGVQWLGVMDWNRRLFDSLIPLPDGTSYNSYLVRGSEKTALIDTVDPTVIGKLLDALSGVEAIDYIVSHHTEQDHSGSLPIVLEKYPQARLVCSKRAEAMLMDHLHIPPEKFQVVADGEEISLGNKHLRFIYTPWVHWPETMVTHLPEDKILFTCDFFGSHLATSRLFAGEDPVVYEAAKSYYAEIMMPFRGTIPKNLEKISELSFDLIAPSHGPLYDKPNFILDAYKDWVSDRVANMVVIPYISMHGSTEMLVDHLVGALMERGVGVQKFDLAVTDLGKLASSLVDAATIVIGTPIVLTGVHPSVFYAVYLANLLKPKVRYAAIVSSYGWGGKIVEQITGMIPNLKVDVLGAHLCKGLPGGDDFSALDILADVIKEKHSQL